MEAYTLDENKLIRADTKERTFGMEIEYEFCGLSNEYHHTDQVRALANNQLENVVGDGSLDVGVEVVSKVMTSDALKEWLLTSDSITYGDAHGYEDADTNGIHIHYGVQNYNDDYCKAIKSRAILLSSLLSEELGEVFRYSSWCLSNFNDLRYSIDNVFDNSSDFPSPFTGDKNFERSFLSANLNSGRYRNVNTDTGHGTIEFRMFPYSNDNEERFKYIDFVNNFIDIIESDMSLKEMVESHWTIDEYTYEICAEKNAYSVENLEESQFEKQWKSTIGHRESLLDRYMNAFSTLVDDDVEERTELREFKYDKDLVVRKDEDMWKYYDKDYTLMSIELLCFVSSRKYKYDVLKDIVKDKYENNPIVLKDGFEINDISFEKAHSRKEYVKSAVINKLMYNFDRSGLYIEITGEFYDDASRTTTSDKSVRITHDSTIRSLIKAIWNKKMEKFIEFENKFYDIEYANRTIRNYEYDINQLKRNLENIENDYIDIKETLTRNEKEYEVLLEELEKEND